MITRLHWIPTNGEKNKFWFQVEISVLRLRIKFFNECLSADFSFNCMERIVVHTCMTYNITRMYQMSFSNTKSWNLPIIGYIIIHCKLNATTTTVIRIFNSFSPAAARSAANPTYMYLKYFHVRSEGSFEISPGKSFFGTSLCLFFKNFEQLESKGTNNWKPNDLWYSLQKAPKC